MIKTQFNTLKKVLEGVVLDGSPAFKKIDWWLEQPTSGTVIITPAAFIELGNMPLEATGFRQYSYDLPFTIYIYTEFHRSDDKVGDVDNPIFALTEGTMDALARYDLTALQPPHRDNAFLMSSISGHIYGTGVIAKRRNATSIKDYEKKKIAT